jgi:hypothetical protein
MLPLKGKNPFKPLFGKEGKGRFVIKLAWQVQEH